MTFKVIGATTFGITTLSITTFSIVINKSRHLAYQRSISSATMRNVIVPLSVILLNVVMLNVVAPTAFAFSKMKFSMALRIGEGAVAEQ